MSEEIEDGVVLAFTPDEVYVLRGALDRESVRAAAVARTEGYLSHGGQLRLKAAAEADELLAKIDRALRSAEAEREHPQHAPPPDPEPGDAEGHALALGWYEHHYGTTTAKFLARYDGTAPASPEILASHWKRWHDLALRAEPLGVLGGKRRKR